MLENEITALKAWDAEKGQYEFAEVSQGVKNRLGLSIAEIGITVVFGNSISGESERVYGDGKVWLTTVPVPKQRCELLAPVIGKEIQTILSGG